MLKYIKIFTYVIGTLCVSVIHYFRQKEYRFYLYCISVLFGVAVGWNSQRENALKRSTLITLPPLL